jgi:hypothetical protein
MKTTDEILVEMDAAQANFPVLANLDSTSDTSFFVSLKRFFALLMQMLYAEWDRFKLEVETIISANTAGSLSWYVTQLKSFQYGDTVSIIGGRVGYEVQDETKRIVVQVTATEDVGGRITFRAAKTGEDANQALTADELDALKTYVGKVKFAGVVCDTISMDADDLKLQGTVKVDRQIFKSDGSLLADPTKFPVRDAIVAYLKALPENSVLNNTSLTDQVQKVRGVRDFTISLSATRRPTLTDWTNYAQEVLSQAGHMKLHNDSNLSYQF